MRRPSASRGGPVRHEGGHTPVLAHQPASARRTPEFSPAESSETEDGDVALIRERGEESGESFIPWKSAMSPFPARRSSPESPVTTQRLEHPWTFLSPKTSRWLFGR